MIDLPVLSYVIIGFLIALLLGVVNVYNRLIRYKNAAEANLGQIKVAMKKRLDMIEQLLGAVRGYIKHERELFENIAKLRSGLMEADPGYLKDIDRESRRITHNLLAVAEAYPDIKASDTVNRLMESIVNVENEIARHRYTFNNIVQEYNTMLDTIPSNIIAGAVGSKRLNYLEFEEEIQQAPDVTVKTDG